MAKLLEGQRGTLFWRVRFCGEYISVASELARAGLRSGPKISATVANFVSAAHSSASKLARHKSVLATRALLD
jgi:hypothetical protein